MKFWMVHFIVAASSFRVVAGDALPFDLGCGDPTLHINYNTTNQYVIYLNVPPVVNDIDIHSGGYEIDTFQNGWPKRQIILRSIESPTNEDAEMLYPFGEQMAFACPNGGSGWASEKDAFDPKKYRYWPRKTQVFSAFLTNKDGLLVSDDVYALARSRYGLTTNQLFLGKVGTNIFYWETQNPTRVYYRNVEEMQARKYFKLPKSVLDVFGITKAMRPNKDVGIWASRRTIHWIVVGSPYDDDVFEFRFKDAKQVKADE